MDKQLFGRSLKNHRKINKITQEKLAELIDIDPRQIARIEAGGSLPSLETFLKITKVLNISPNELLNHKIEENTAENLIKNDIYDILSLAKKEQLELIKKLILAVIY
ncbi:helix-turn-helix transcriptional regulator [bacterium]|nr:helix-turn-helix transcriptional regulator [bacterium]